MSSKRIAIAGFQHETNTFAPGCAGLHEFTIADSWPELLRGQQLITVTRNLNLPIGGAITVAEQHGIQLVPVLWCAAEPSGPVTTDAFECIAGEIENSIREAGPLDAIYLDLHGAMVTEEHHDGEAELLRRLRDGPARDTPIGISLDLHANISAQLARQATLISVYQTYPHLDMADTGAKCMQRLISCLGGLTVFTAYRQIPYLIPLHAQYTGQSPCNQLYQQLEKLADPLQREHIELALGFTAADIPDCGPSIVAAASNQARAEELADLLYREVQTAESDYDISLYRADEAVQLALASDRTKPIVIADVQDNAGAGGTADTTGLLQTLIDQRARNTIVGVMCDAETAELAHANGIGQSINTAIGAKSGLPDHAPVPGDFLVLALSDGLIAYTGEMYKGVTASIGKSCLLAYDNNPDGIQIVVSSCRTQCLDQALFTHFGVDLSRKEIIVVKSTVHFRADFESIAGQIINAAAPGAFDCDLSTVDYRNLRSGVRVGPMGSTYK